MIEDGWQKRCTEMLRECLPEMSETPLYILDGRELPGGNRPGMLAITSQLLAVQMKSYIGDRWEGNGFCTVVRPDAHRSWHHIESTVVHELAHHYAPDELSSAMVGYFLNGRTLDDPDVVARVEIQSTVPKGDTNGLPPWIGHDGEYIRCLVHLIHRVNSRDWGIDCDDCYPCREYQLKSIRDYAEQMAGEPEALVSLPMDRVMAMGPTDRFREFCDVDVERAKASLQAPSGSVS